MESRNIRKSRNVYKYGRDKYRPAKNEIKRMNYVQGSGSRVKMPNLHHSIKYDWKNDTHIFWASVSYVIYALGKSPVIDTGDVDISAYHEAVDNNDYTSGGITY